MSSLSADSVMDHEGQSNLLRNSGLFDSSWYQSQYRDVELLGMDPLEHYVRFGGWMNRRPNATFDPMFYSTAYSDVRESGMAPLVHYLAHGSGRPTTEAELFDDLARIRAQMPGRQPHIDVSYCIPVLGRIEDLKATLQDNLSAHAGLAGTVEFVIAVFDDDAGPFEWISNVFAKYIAAGLLRAFRSPELDTWHFGKAKNTFRQSIRGRIYSSLDADNFVTVDETQTLLAISSRTNGYFFAHHFSGDWGDGSSGRVSMPAEAYWAVGYDTRLLPRQYDEIDLILSTLRRFPAMPFYCRSLSTNVLSRPGETSNFFRSECFPNQIHAMPEFSRRPALNPRGAGYTRSNAKLRAMADFNGACSRLSLARQPSARGSLARLVERAKFRLLEATSAEDLLEMLFERADVGRVRRATVGAMPLFACIKNDEWVLSQFFEHYRRIGVSSFFIVDDGSSIPMEDVYASSDVCVVRPKVGEFKSSKTLWIEALMKAVLREGAWYLAVDSDEFIDLPNDIEELGQFKKMLELRNETYCPGVLVEMLPSPSLTLSRVQQNAPVAFRDIFDYCVNVRTAPSPEYLRHSSVQWGFGEAADLSWRLDARHHIFGSFDSLRKIPLAQHSSTLHLNQGFHTLSDADARTQVADPGELWSRKPILPVRHYKTAKTFVEGERLLALERAESYHERSRDNIRTIFEAGAEAIYGGVQRLSASICHISDVRTFPEFSVLPVSNATAPARPRATDGPAD